MKTFLAIFLIIHGIEMICGDETGALSTQAYQQPSESYLNRIIQEDMQNNVHQSENGQGIQPNSQENQVLGNYQQSAVQNQLHVYQNQPSAPNQLSVQTQQIPGQNQQPSVNNQPHVEIQYPTQNRNPVQYQQLLPSQSPVQNQHPTADQVFVTNQPTAQNQYPTPNQSSDLKQAPFNQFYPHQLNKPPQVPNYPQFEPSPSSPTLHQNQLSADSQQTTTTNQDEEELYHQPYLHYQRPFFSPPVVPPMDFGPMGPMGSPLMKPRYPTGVRRPVPPFTQPFY